MYLVEMGMDDKPIRGEVTGKRRSQQMLRHREVAVACCTEHDVID